MKVQTKGACAVRYWSPDKQLLRGKIGRIHSWKEADTEGSVWEGDVRILHALPAVVCVKFDNCRWHLEGTPEPGISSNESVPPTDMVSG